MSPKSGGHSHKIPRCLAEGWEQCNPAAPAVTTLPVDPGGPRGPWVPTPGLPFSPFSPGKPKETALIRATSRTAPCSGYDLTRAMVPYITFHLKTDERGGRRWSREGSFFLSSPIASQGNHGVPGVLTIPAARVDSSGWFTRAQTSFQLRFLLEGCFWTMPRSNYSKSEELSEPHKAVCKLWDPEKSDF